MYRYKIIRSQSYFYAVIYLCKLRTRKRNFSFYAKKKMCRKKGRRRDNIIWSSHFFSFLEKQFFETYKMETDNDLHVSKSNQMTLFNVIKEA